MALFHLISTAQARSSSKVKQTFKYFNYDLIKFSKDFWVLWAWDSLKVLTIKTIWFFAVALISNSSNWSLAWEFSDKFTSTACLPKKKVILLKKVQIDFPYRVIHLISFKNFAYFNKNISEWNFEKILIPHISFFWLIINVNLIIVGTRLQVVILQTKTVNIINQD